jgi:hypothetical protein
MVKLVNGVIVADDAAASSDGGAMTGANGGLSSLSEPVVIFGFVLPTWALGAIVLMGFMFGGAGGGMVMGAVLGVVSE